MGYSVRFLAGDEVDEAEVFDLTSASGLALLSAWASSLPAGEFDAGVRLFDEGKCEGTDRLSEQLARALADHPPGDADVKHTAQVLLALTGVGDPDESAAIVE